MLSDIIYWVDQLALFATAGIFLLATFRAFQIRRALMKGVYQSRASWIGVTLAVISITNLASVLSPNGNFSLLFLLPSLMFLFAFVDSSIRVTEETDFFHRSALGWPRLRKAFYGLLGASVVILAWAINFASLDTLPGQLGAIQFFIVIGLLFPYSAAALIVGSRRTPDRTMRRFVRMLSLALVCVATFFLIWAPFNVVVPGLGDTISYFFFAGAAYFLFRAVMSLSPVSRVEKEVYAAFKPGEGSVTMPSPS